MVIEIRATRLPIHGDGTERSKEISPRQNKFCKHKKYFLQSAADDADADARRQGPFRLSAPHSRDQVKKTNTKREL